MKDDESSKGIEQKHYPYKDDVKEKFPETLKQCFGNISRACKVSNINRSTYYIWRSEDLEFAKLCDEADAYTGDYVEDKLMQAIMKGDLRAIIYYCKTKLRDRGYGATLELTGAKGGPLSLSNDDDESKRLELLSVDELREYYKLKKKMYGDTSLNPKN